MERDWLVVIGLFCDIVGALFLGWGLLASPQQAIERAMTDMPWASDKDNLQEPAVQHHLLQSRNTKIGLGLLAFGFLLQAIGQWPS